MWFAIALFNFRFYASSNFCYKGYDRADFKQVDSGIELAESAILQVNNEDLVRLERIHEFWAKRERRMKVIIPTV